MNTTTDKTLTDWAAALTSTGWALHDRQTPAHLAGFKELCDPAGRVLARACAYPDGGPIEVTLLSTARTASGGATWHVIADWLPAEVVIAAARDADETSGTAAGDLLTATGWRLQRYEALSPTLAEHQWASPDDTRWACFTTPDADPDAAVGSGGWILARPGDSGKQQRITASASTPAATVAALALSA